MNDLSGENYMEILDVKDIERWNYLVRTFKKYDIYYLCEYNIALMLHGDGQPQLIYFEYQGTKLAYVMFKNDISQLKVFDGILEEGKYFDWTAPYGYGGPLFEGEFTEDIILQFKNELFAYCTEHNIVSQFFRFHPLLQNYIEFSDLCDLICLKNTVSIDVSNRDNIDKNMTSECRNRIRKAEKNGIQIFGDRGENLEDFLEIYDMTMDFHQADEYYYFKKEYFDYLIKNMNDNIIFFHAKKDEMIISSAMFIYNDTYVHYHLGGTRIEYRKYAPFNLLLRTVAHWASENGMCEFHLGGGTEAEDSLYRFKRNFCPQGVKAFYIGRTIFNQDAFDKLIELRKMTDSSFDSNIPFLIKYRALGDNDMVSDNCKLNSLGGGINRQK